MTKFLRKKMGINLWQLNLDKKFLDLTPKVQSIEGK